MIYSKIWFNNLTQKERVRWSDKEKNQINIKNHAGIHFICKSTIKNGFNWILILNIKKISCEKHTRLCDDIAAREKKEKTYFMWTSVT